MLSIKSMSAALFQRLPSQHQEAESYTSPISEGELTGEYLLLRIPESLSDADEEAVKTLLTETNQNHDTKDLTKCEGYPSLFPPGTRLFATAAAESRIPDLETLIKRFNQIFRQEDEEVIVINTARIAENIRIAEQDSGKSGEIARQNIEALDASLSVLPDECTQFVDENEVPTAARDSHLISFKESALYR